MHTNGVGSIDVRVKCSNTEKKRCLVFCGRAYLLKLFGHDEKGVNRGKASTVGIRVDDVDPKSVEEKTTFAEIFHDNSILDLHSVNTLPPSSNVSNASNPRNPYARSLTQPTASQQEGTSRIQININPATKFIDYLRQTLEAVLVTSIDNYDTQVNTNKAASQLEAFTTELLHEQATSDTATQMDFSPSVSPQELQELIAKSTSKAVSTLTREIQSLKSKLENSKSNNSTSQSKNTNKSSKNSQQRGKNSASLKKKKEARNTSRSRSPNPKTKKSSQNSPNKTKRNHVDKNNVSSDEAKKKHNRPRRSRSKGRRPNSRPNSNQN